MYFKLRARATQKNIVIALAMVVLAGCTNPSVTAKKGQAHNEQSAVSLTPENSSPALATLKKTSVEQPNNPEALFNLAVAYAQDAEKKSSVEQHQLAITTFKQVLQLVPGNVATLKALYAMYYDDTIGGDSTAFTHATNIFKQLPPASRTQVNPPSLAKFISTYIQQKKTGRSDPAELYRILLTAIHEQPYNDNAYIQLAKMYRDLHYYPLALATLKLGAEEITTSEELYKAIAITYEAHAEANGCVYENTKYSNEAIEYYKRAIALKPDDAELHYNLARLYFDKNLYQLAIFETDIVLELKPTAGNLAFAAQHYSMLGKQKKADEFIEQAKSAGLALADSGYHEIYMNSGEWIKAARSFSDYLQAQQVLSAYDVIKADIIQQQTDMSFEKIISAKKLTPSTEWERALIAFWNNKISRKQLEKMAATRCERTEYFFYSGYRDYIAGNKKMADEQFTRAIQQNTYRFIERPLARYFLDTNL